MGIPLEVQAKPRAPVYFDGEIIGYVNYMRQGDRIPLERPSMNWIGTIECYAMGPIKLIMNNAYTDQ